MRIRPRPGRVHGVAPSLAALIILVAAGAAGSRRGAADAGCDAGADASPRAVADSELRLVLNIPAYRLDVIEHGAVTRTIPVAVGQRRYPTPIGSYAIDEVIWNPWWHPPDREWARNERITPPGWQNPVGRVKLHVTGLVFLHGTPLEESLGSAASHACVRMTNRDAVALARLVHRRASPALSSATLDSLEADTAASRRIRLESVVPIEIRYVLAEVLADDLVVYPDIYRLAGRGASTASGAAIAAILRTGRDTSGLERARLDRALRQGRRRMHAIALDSLFVVSGLTSR